MALVQAVNTRIVLPVSLGTGGFLEFRPSYREGARAAPTMRLLVRAAGVTETLWQRAAPPGPWPPPEAESVSLSAFDGSRVELLLESQGPADAEHALWISPLLIFREPPPGPAPTAPASEPPRRPNVVLIGADTLRADALGAWGCKPSLTPALDRLARESDVWLSAFSTFNTTAPSFASILTGLYGKEHGLYGNRTRLGADAVTLADVLSANGYATGAFLSARHLYTAGLAQGFEKISAPNGHQAGEMATNSAMSWIARTAEPFFAWIHLYDPHTPHTPPGRFATGYRPAEASGLEPPASWVPFRAPGPRLFEDWVVMGHRDLYPGEVAYLDRQVDRLVDFLRSRDELAGTLIAFVGDHGENLGERDIRFRHTGLWDTVVHVPLMIRWPGTKRSGRRLPELVQTLDLFPTVLQALDISLPPNSGRELRELSAAGGREAVFAEQAGRKGRMLRTHDAKYFRSSLGRAHPQLDYLYDLSRDPGERENLAARKPELRVSLGRALEAWARSGQGRGTVEDASLTRAELDELRSLGYVD
jgi:arylsulfatase A-like enzyme